MIHPLTVAISLPLPLGPFLFTGALKYLICFTAFEEIKATKLDSSN